MATASRSSRRSSTELSISTRMSSREPQPFSDWLPPARSGPLLMLSAQRLGLFIHNNRHQHWFLQFAHALSQNQYDSHQYKMIAKLYGFLYDFLPDGLTGEWEHISGAELMGLLTCSTKEFAVTRHKATQGAQAALESMEEWMKKGADWREAVKNTKAETKQKGSRSSQKPPLIYSPAGLATILVLAYPDSKFHNWVGRLELTWMLRRRDSSLQVSSGFWKGITSKDLTFFQPDKRRATLQPLLKNYDQLFGKDFVQARKDIRPFLPKWAADLLSGIEMPISIGSSDDDADNAPADELDAPPDGDADPETDVSATEAVKGPLASDGSNGLGTHLLTPGIGMPVEELRDWLTGKLAAEDKVLLFWCHHWAGKADEACGHEDQLIMRSLFVQSLSRLHSLCGVPKYAAMADAFMLLDVYDTRTEAQPGDAKTMASVKRVSEAPMYAPIARVHAKLIERARDNSRRDLLRTAFQEQLVQLFNLVKDRDFHAHLEAVSQFEAARDNVVLEEVADEATIAVDEIDGDLITAIHITKWQVRTLAVTSKLDAAYVLTWEQLCAATRLEAGRGLDAQDRIEPVMPTGHALGGLSAEAQELVRKLLGDWDSPSPSSHDVDTADKIAGCASANSQPGQEATKTSITCMPSDTSDSSTTGPPVIDVPDVSSPGPATAQSVSEAPADSLASPITVPSVQEVPIGSRTQQVTPVLSTRGLPPSSQAQHKTMQPSAHETPAGQPNATASGGTGCTTSAGRRETPWKNPFTSRPGKRSASPDLRSVKFPRLTAQDVREELKTIVDAGTHQLHQEVTSSKEILLDFTEEQMGWLNTEVAKGLRKERESIEAKFTSTADNLKTNLESTMEAKFQSMSEGLESKVKSAMEAKFQSMSEGLESKVKSISDTLETRIQSNIDSQMRSVTQALEALRESLPREPAKVVPQAGQDGFLTLHCPAPPGWSQSAYEGFLLRAGWYYVSQIGFPDEGFEGDAEAFDNAMEEYYGIESDHLRTALSHIHRLAYDRPFSEENDSEENDTQGE